MRVLVAASAAFALTLGMALPAAALTHERFAIDDVLNIEYNCGVIEVTQIHGEATARWLDDGTMQSFSIRFEYDGVLTDPATGRSIEQHARQNVTDRDGLVASRGRGIFLRIAGEGVVLHDVGRLVFDPSDGSTQFATPKVLPFDDATVGDRVDAAVCSMFD